MGAQRYQWSSCPAPGRVIMFAGLAREVSICSRRVREIPQLHKGGEMNLRSLRCTLFWAGIALVAAGCGDDALDPNVTGLVNAFVHDTPAGAAAFTGTVAGDQHVSIRSTGDTWVDVGMPNGITVALQSTTPTTVHGSTSVPAGSYDRVRLTLSAVMVSR